MRSKKIGWALALFTLLLAVSSVVLAAEGGEAGGEAGKAGGALGMAIALGAAFGIAIAAVGGALSQGKAIAAALEGIARNPGAAGKVMTPMIIGLAMIESLVIYALVISLMLVMKV